MSYHSWFFFFQAEDGIRDVAVTGVQTCALPISYFVQSERRTRMNQLEKDDNATCVMTYSHDGFGLGQDRSDCRVPSQMPQSKPIVRVGHDARCVVILLELIHSRPPFRLDKIRGRGFAFSYIASLVLKGS